MPSITFTLQDNAAAKALADYLRSKFPQHDTGQGDGAFIKRVTIKEFYEPYIKDAVAPAIKSEENAKADVASMTRIQAEVDKITIT